VRIAARAIPAESGRAEKIGVAPAGTSHDDDFVVVDAGAHVPDADVIAAADLVAGDLEARQAGLRDLQVGLVLRRILAKIGRQIGCRRVIVVRRIGVLSLGEAA
jgi:hypothetical protein